MALEKGTLNGIAILQDSASPGTPYVAGTDDGADIVLESCRRVAQTAHWGRPQPPHCFMDAAYSLGLGAHPSTKRFAFNQSSMQTKLDMTEFKQARLIVRTNTGSTSANTPRILVQYRATSSNTASDWSLDLCTSELSCSIVANTTTVVSSWIDLAAGAKADNFVGAFDIGGDSSASPSLFGIWLQLR